MTLWATVHLFLSIRKIHDIKILSYDDSSHSFKCELYGGVDVSFLGENNKNDGAADEEIAVAVYVIMREREIVYRSYEYFSISVPYVSSFLSFREIDPLVRSS